MGTQTSLGLEQAEPTTPSHHAGPSPCMFIVLHAWSCTHIFLIMMYHINITIIFILLVTTSTPKQDTRPSPIKRRRLAMDETSPMNRLVFNKHSTIPVILLVAYKRHTI
jgi:hypothetical protein